MLPPEARWTRVLRRAVDRAAQLQNLEPAGVGARSPGECLCLQMKALRRMRVRDLALVIAEKHLELLASRDYTRLKSATGADDDALRAAQRLILRLNPRPGAAFAKIEARYVIPDVIVKKSATSGAPASTRGDAAPAHQPSLRRARRGGRAAATRSPRSCRRRAG
jgi:DNA-directed RNA polymerase specialized sigma54-like protein